MNYFYMLMLFFYIQNFRDSNVNYMAAKVLVKLYQYFDLDYRFSIYRADFNIICTLFYLSIIRIHEILIILLIIHFIDLLILIIRLNLNFTY